MELLITNVTVMHGGNFCVAGWDLAVARWFGRYHPGTIGVPF